jgi:hypothetical protein
MLTYSQSTGKLTDDNGMLWGVGYSGFGDDKNQPASQEKPGLGPIPQGRWSIGAPHDDAEVGAFAMRLLPGPNTATYGRSAFLIHGDSIVHPGRASHGCIILARSVRERIDKDNPDRILEVIA